MTRPAPRGSAPTRLARNHLAQTERAALCDTAVAVGEDRPTLCEGWTVKDLVVHLLVREGSPASLGIVLAPLARVTALASGRIARTDFATLVDRLRSGPPRLSPLAIPRLDELGNTLEYVIHHEDIRRAQPDWAPRALGDEVERTLWPMVRMMGKRLAKPAPVGVRIHDTVSGSTAELTQATDGAVVTIEGRPSELALYLFGRQKQADVELLGDPAAVSRLQATSLGG